MSLPINNWLFIIAIRGAAHATRNATMGKVKIKGKSKPAAPRTATSESSAAAPARRDAGVAKRKHAHAGDGRRALAAKLQAEEGGKSGSSSKPQSAKDKVRRKRDAKSAILGAVGGIKASLEELLASHEKRAKQQKEETTQATVGSLTSKKRQKLVAEETLHIQQVLEHPSFVADPFAALQSHLRNTVDAMHKPEHELWERGSRGGKAKGGKRR